MNLSIIQFAIIFIAYSVAVYQRKIGWSFLALMGIFGYYWLATLSGRPSIDFASLILIMVAYTIAIYYRLWLPVDAPSDAAAKPSSDQVEKQITAQQNKIVEDWSKAARQADTNNHAA